jgi:hypothetical protein
MTLAFWMNAAVSGFSRASSLLQKGSFAFAFHTQAGREAAVLLLLICF